ncbi:hypothetical protein CCMA1212_007409 [Trichoderma ghanense]|uniref:Uncharacterized protein n=1 Tax=Trichoderma ghanense TaxID=65468 RepID=A0ABY2GZQ8_9HYPO
MDLIHTVPSALDRCTLSKASEASQYRIIAAWSSRSSSGAAEEEDKIAAYRRYRPKLAAAGPQQVDASLQPRHRPSSPPHPHPHPRPPSLPVTCRDFAITTTQRLRLPPSSPARHPQNSSCLLAPPVGCGSKPPPKTPAAATLQDRGTAAARRARRFLRITSTRRDETRINLQDSITGLPRISRRWLLNLCEQSYSTVLAAATIYAIPTVRQALRPARRFGNFAAASLGLYASRRIDDASSAHLYGLPRIPDELAAPRLALPVRHSFPRGRASTPSADHAVAPSSRIGPIACQASSFASARSLRRRCQADRFFHELPQQRSFGGASRIIPLTTVVIARLPETSTASDRRSYRRTDFRDAIC